MYFKTDNHNWLYAGAVVFALGFFNKYNVVFQLLGLFPALLLTPQRKMFTRPALYIAAGIALMLISPNLWWQYQHGFPVFYHLQQLADTQLVNVDRLGFLKAQLLFYIGSVIVLAASLYSLLFYQPFRSFAFLFWSMLFTLGVFIAFRAKDYYAIGIYPIYISFGAVYLESVCQEGWKRYLRPVLLVIPILLFVPVMNVAFPNKSPEYVISHADQYKRFGLLRWEDGQDHMLPQDFADMLGWKELARKVDSVYAVASKVGNTLVLCDNYGQTGAINFYTKQSIKAVSFNADYIYWFDLSKPYVNLIRVKWPEKIETELPETSPYFREGIIAETVTNPYARESGTKIYYFAGAKVDIRPRLQAEIDELSERALKSFNVPGIAVAVIKDGKVIHAKGYGVRNIATGEKVNENTFYGIASNSKAFTTAALAMLIEEKKLKWDDKVTDYLPDFKMYSPFVTVAA
jgi:hypothetical protein